MEKLRNAKGWTLEKLAEVAGLTPRTMDNISKGRPVFRSTLLLLAKAFGVQASDLLSRELIADDSSKASATSSGNVAITLTINKSISDFTTEDKDDLIAKIQVILNHHSHITIMRIDSGSVLVTLSLPAELAEQLALAVRKGKLADLNVIDADIYEIQEGLEISDSDEITNWIEPGEDFSNPYFAHTNSFDIDIQEIYDRIPEVDESSRYAMLSSFPGKIYNNDYDSLPFHGMTMTDRETKIFNLHLTIEASYWWNTGGIQLLQFI